MAAQQSQYKHAAAASDDERAVTVAAAAGLRPRPPVAPSPTRTHRVCMSTQTRGRAASFESERGSRERGTHGKRPLQPALLHRCAELPLKQYVAGLGEARGGVEAGISDAAEDLTCSMPAHAPRAFLPAFTSVNPAACTVSGRLSPLRTCTHATEQKCRRH